MKGPRWASRDDFCLAVGAGAGAGAGAPAEDAEATGALVGAGTEEPQPVVASMSKQESFVFMLNLRTCAGGWRKRNVRERLLWHADAESTGQHYAGCARSLGGGEIEATDEVVALASNRKIGAGRYAERQRDKWYSGSI